METIKELFDYKEMIKSLVRQDLKGKYKGSFLGFLWTFLNPLFQLVIYTFVFDVIMKQNIEDYYLFIFVAFVPWIFITTTVVAGARAVLNRQDLVKKIYFPRLVLPVAHTLSGFINMLFSFIIVFGALAVSGRGIDVSKTGYFLLVLLITFLFGLGLTTIFSAITVFFRDLEYILSILSMAWMYITPIMYPEDLVPEEYRNIFNLNPATPIIRSYRAIFYYKTAPYLSDCISALVVSLVLIIIGYAIFMRAERRFAEEL